MAKPKKPDPKHPAKEGRARERGDARVFTTEFDPELLEAIDAFVASHKPKTSRRAILEWMAEEFLTKRGLWPVVEGE